MESVTGHNVFEVDDKKSPLAKPKQEPEGERVKLGRAESTKIAVWLKQLDEFSKGFLQLTKSDLVNFLIRERKDELTTKEIVQIRTNHYDPIRHLNWITPRLKDVLNSGDADQIARLQDEIRSIELSVIRRVTAKNGNPVAPNEVKQKRSRRPKKAVDTETVPKEDVPSASSIRNRGESE